MTSLSGKSLLVQYERVRKVLRHFDGLIVVPLILHGKATVALNEPVDGDMLDDETKELLVKAYAEEFRVVLNQNTHTMQLQLVPPNPPEHYHPGPPAEVIRTLTVPHSERSFAQQQQHHQGPNPRHALIEPRPDPAELYLLNAMGVTRHHKQQQQEPVHDETAAAGVLPPHAGVVVTLTPPRTPPPPPPPLPASEPQNPREEEDDEIFVFAMSQDLLAPPEPAPERDQEPPPPRVEDAMDLDDPLPQLLVPPPPLPPPAPPAPVALGSVRELRQKNKPVVPAKAVVVEPRVGGKKLPPRPPRAIPIYIDGDGDGDDDDDDSSSSSSSSVVSSISSDNGDQKKKKKKSTKKKEEEEKKDEDEEEVEEEAEEDEEEDEEGKEKLPYATPAPNEKCKYTNGKGHVCDKPAVYKTPRTVFCEDHRCKLCAQDSVCRIMQMGRSKCNTCGRPGLQGGGASPSKPARGRSQSETASKKKKRARDKDANDMEEGKDKDPNPQPTKRARKDPNPKRSNARKASL